jgi:hypothetical protein
LCFQNRSDVFFLILSQTLVGVTARDQGKWSICSNGQINDSIREGGAAMYTDKQGGRGRHNSF